MTYMFNRLDDSPRGQIIKLLQRHGALGVKELRRELGVSDTAVRQQIRALLAEGLIQARTEQRKRPGRPSQQYELTEEARSLFACYCEDLALNLYTELLADQGPEVVSRLLDRVGMRLARQYQQQVKGRALQERVRSLARVLDEKGIMSDVSQAADAILLHEYHCPYYELASTHREICEMEQEMISQVLDADVTLTNCMMDGHTNCSFSVKQRIELDQNPVGD
ncbi:MAG: winged helix-turn-helix transcriptional regulator [Chloroflexi bacterium]|nr:MAG: winged helix-turn-helix transcriptional regulator [Chloroflexota bacterium]